MTISKSLWHVHEGADIWLYTLANDFAAISISNLGCVVQAIRLRESNETRNIVLGYNNATDYLADPFYIGCLVGRFAGRIAGASFTINSTDYKVTANEQPAGNHLHGGHRGFNKKIFTVTEEGANDEKCYVTLQIISPHLEEGYPGNLSVTVNCSLNIKNEFIITYEAITSHATHVNLTHHHYFNLCGDARSGIEQELVIHAEEYLQTDRSFLPDGVILPLKQSTYDFSKRRSIKNAITEECMNVYYVLNKNNDEEAAVLYDEQSGRALHIRTTYPCLVLYAGDFLRYPFAKHQGICLETQHFPDAPHHRNFPTTLLMPENRYFHETRMSFSKTNQTTPMMMTRSLLQFLLCMLIGVLSFAQENVVTISTDKYAMVMQTDDDQRLCIVYSGKKLNNDAEYVKVKSQYHLRDDNSALSNVAYTPAGTWNLVEPAIAVQHADGNNSLELKYVSHQTAKQNGSTLTTIKLKDPVYGTEVELYYKAFGAENVIEQWTVIRNTEKKNIILEKYASANLYFSADKFFLRHYHGVWANEMKPEVTELTAGIKTLDSKLGTRANLFQPPSFLLSFNTPAKEENGEVLLGTLAWTGNFRIDFEKDNFNNLRLIAGINPYASAYHLAPGKEFKTPSFIYAYSANGKGDASRNLHRWARNFRIPDGNGSRLTLLNNWEATYFDFDEKKLVGLFQGAKEIGVDMFLLDDGWFGNKYPRNNDQAGLGDWQENRKKLPHGIGYLVKEATKAGIKFGIWIEPEMVNPKSELYEKHRDWVIRQPQRKEYYFRNQLVLDLSNPAVQEFVYGVIDSLFIKNPDLAFIKWDCNAVMYNAHSNYLEENKIPQSHLYVDYVKGLYAVLERFRKKYPDVPMMLCSGGGGRVDYEAMKYFTEFWPSDNTDPMERIFIQWENSYFFPAITSCNHVTNWSNTSLKFKTDVAMMGKLGFDIVVSELSDKDKLFAKSALTNYKHISSIIWHGDLYRLADPTVGNHAAALYVGKDKEKAVLFNFLTGTRYLPNVNAEPVKLAGLDPNKMYQVKEINIYPGEKSTLEKEKEYSGDFLMNVGINPELSKERKSVILVIE